MANILSNIVTKIRAGAEKVSSFIKNAVSTVVDKSINLVSNVVGGVANITSRAVVQPLIKQAASDAALATVTYNQNLAQQQKTVSANTYSQVPTSTSSISPYVLLAIAGGAVALIML